MKRLVTITTITLTAGVLGAFLFIGGTNPKTGVPDPITVDGQTINFTWTDDNTGEDLHIWTDQATYTNGLSHATVYVAVANQSGIEQDVELMAYFRDSQKRIDTVEVLAEVTEEVNEPILEEVCEQMDKRSTSTECYQVQTGTTTSQVTNNKWVSLDTVARTPVEKTKEAIWLKGEAMKTIEDGFIAEKKTAAYTLPADGVLYYKVDINFPANADDNFYFTAVGSAGSKGHLDPWFNSSWPYRVQIDVNPAKVGTSSAITNFPVYLDLAGLPAAFWTNVSSTGADIRMTESDGSTETPFELVSIATTTKRGELHFLADSLSTTTNTTFYLYYGNPSASAYSATSTYGRNNVWSAYRAVYHLSDENDSTANGYNMTQTTGGGVTFQSGKVGNDGSSGTTPSPSSNALRRASFALMTTGEYDGSWKASFWIKRNTATTTWFYMIMLRSTATRRQSWWQVTDTQTAFLGGAATGPTTTPLTVGTYYKFDVVADGTNLNIYRDGQFVKAASGYKSSTSAYQDVFGFFGYLENAVVQGSPVSMDENRITVGSTHSSPAWILTEYNNQSSTSTFLTISGTQENEATTTPQTTIRGGVMIGGGGIIK